VVFGREALRTRSRRAVPLPVFCLPSLTRRSSLSLSPSAHTRDGQAAGLCGAEEAHELFKKIDADASGQISREEFLQYFGNEVGERAYSDSSARLCLGSTGEFCDSLVNRRLPRSEGSCCRSLLTQRAW
jgi:hypothetical protein